MTITNITIKYVICKILIIIYSASKPYQKLVVGIPSLLNAFETITCVLVYSKCHDSHVHALILLIWTLTDFPACLFEFVCHFLVVLCLLRFYQVNSKMPGHSASCSLCPVLKAISFMWILLLRKKTRKTFLFKDFM